MKKLLWMSALLYGLVLLSLLPSIGRVHARTLDLRPVQVQNSGSTDSQGTITVSAFCPKGYHVQNGNVQITTSNQSQTPTYVIRSNGPDAQKDAWVTTVENRVAGSLSITVTATCVSQA